LWHPSQLKIKRSENKRWVHSKQRLIAAQSKVYRQVFKSKALTQYEYQQKYFWQCWDYFIEKRSQYVAQRVKEPCVRYCKELSVNWKRWGLFGLLDWTWKQSVKGIGLTGVVWEEAISRISIARVIF
jgi:hypothetical protein